MAVTRTELVGPGPGTTAKLAGHVMGHLSLGYQVTRLVFDVGQPYERFRARYEAAVPPAGPHLGECACRHVRWQGADADADGSGSHGFVLYWRANMTPELTGSGELRPCTAYLMGHHAIHEKGYLHDPAVMLYAPLRTLIYIDSADRTRLAVDQPSTVYASFDNPVITRLGRDLDRQLATLLDALGIAPASPLRERSVGAAPDRVAPVVS